MKSVSDIVVKSNISIKDALKIIENGVKQIALVVDDEGKLLGTVNDGDIRRALLNNISLDDSVEGIYFRTPTVANVNSSKDEIINICTVKKLHQIPIVDSQNNLIGLEVLDELISKNKKPNRVILMVGGLGTRLRPLTNKIPKPMLHVGGKPILQTIVEKFLSYGFVNITMCVNYKSNMIQEYFGDGSKFGVNIDYVFEDKKLGTAGALSLINKVPSEPFFVMNGDLLTDVNFEHLLEHHLKDGSKATMCVREYDIQVPFGVVEIDKKRITSIEEKPVHKFFVSAGIYMLSPELVGLIPKNEFYDMPTLFEKAIEEDINCIPFNIEGYWLDIGRIEEYEKANNEYHKVF